MNRKWWSVIGASLAGGVALIGGGFWLFDSWSFLENLFAEAIGLLFALGVILWLVEAKLLSQRERARAIAEFRLQISQAIGPELPMLALEMAQVLADDFDPRIDLYGPERGNWEETEPLLRTIFKRAWRVNSKAPDRQGFATLEKSKVSSYLTACLTKVDQIRRVLDTKPEFNTWAILGALEDDLEQIESHVESTDELDLLDDPWERYVEMGELGLEILDMLKGWNRLQRQIDPVALDDA